jgi:hypothetical protein
VVFDDTCYFLPFGDPHHAKATFRFLSGIEPRAFLNASIFWDAKRPITADVLGSLRIERPAH